MVKAKPRLSDDAADNIRDCTRWRKPVGFNHNHIGPGRSTPSLSGRVTQPGRLFFRGPHSSILPLHLSARLHERSNDELLSAALELDHQPLKIDGRHGAVSKHRVLGADYRDPLYLAMDVSNA